MKAAKLLVLLGGVLGVIAFFVPMATFSSEGKELGVSAYQLFAGVQVLEQGLEHTQQVEGVTPEQLDKTKHDVTETLREIKGIVLVCFLPGVLLALMGLVAVVRRKFGRLGGAVAVLLGVVAALVFMGLEKGAQATEGEASRGPAMFLLLGTAALGFVGGLLALINPDRGPEHAKARAKAAAAAAAATTAR